jgi:uncharacterized protein RhaS with RHS repeats
VPPDRLRAQCGRYTSPDPLGIGDANSYGYSDLNPVRQSDPLGLYTVKKTFTQKGVSDPSPVCRSTYACSLTPQGT